VSGPGEVELALARRACTAVGLAPDVLRPVRVHSNGVFLHPAARIVVRVGSGFDAAGRAGRAVTVTRWLTEMHYPTVAPMRGVDQPVIFPGDVPVTFWLQVEAGSRVVTAADLGRLLKRLHSLPVPPLSLPRFRPLDRLTVAAAAATWLPADDGRWLIERAAILQQQLENTEFRLGPPGLVHGDAQLGNVIAAVPDLVVADWDGTAVAPREWDLVPTAVEQRFGGSARLLADLLDAYGADPTGDPGWPVLTGIYELRSVAAHIRRAPLSPPHAREAALRIASLRADDRTARWSVVG
jgi:hypothetical protein